MAAKHIVKCKICGKEFDLNSEQGVKCGARRYAHQACYPEGELVEMASQKDPDLVALEQYIMKLFDDDYISPRVRKQIETYRKEYNYTYSGILKSLIWFYEIKGNSKEEANHGIGIVPYIYQESYNYYYNIFLAQKANEDKDVNYFKSTIRSIIIPSPHAETKKPKMFNIDSMED